MSTPVWPPGTLTSPFPQGPFIGATFGQKPNAHRFATNQGYEKSRPMSTMPKGVFSTPMEFTGAQMDTFTNFFNSTLAFGTLEFEWKDFLTNETGVFKFREAEFPNFELVSGANNFVTPPDETGGETQRHYTGTITLERVR